MKKLFILLLACTPYVSWTQQNSWCGTDKVLQDLKAQNPGFEEHMHKSMSKASSHSGEMQKATLYIPVVVHIIHDNGVGNISDEQVASALTILNEDYNRMNADAVATRNTAAAPFAPEAGMMDVKFKLAKIDPNGNCTNGIVRVNAPDLTFNANDDCKYSVNGGSDQWPMDQYLNIWVVNSIENDGGAGIILGYAYLPYWPNGANYGILIRHDSFGNIETALNSDGRTLTHEMGHLLGLSHIFDAGWSGSTGCHTADCAQNGDYCCDTPPQSDANWGCLSTWNSCSDVPLNDSYGFDAVDQIENYMSYNSCQNMFSQDQVGIMQQNFIDISFMAGWVTAQNIAATGINDPETFCKADFDAAKTIVCSGDSIQFYDRSFHSPNNWDWTISPGVEGIDWDFSVSSNQHVQDPLIYFYTPGSYQINLWSTDGVTSDAESKVAYIKVLPATQSIPYWEGFENYTWMTDASNWIAYNPGMNNAFEIESSTGHSGSKCARLQNFGQSGANSDELISTSIDLSVVNPATETVTLSFRYAYRKRNATNDEWLKVFISSDCGDNWMQRKTIHGSNLSPDAVQFDWMPGQQSDWTTVHMTNVTSDYFTENFRVKFEFEGNNGNNFFLDDINIYKGSPSNTVILGVAEEGNIGEMSLFPNPAQEELNVRFAVNNNENLVVCVQDVTGKQIQWHEIHAVSGSNIVVLNTKELASGVYFITINNGQVARTLQFIVE